MIRTPYLLFLGDAPTRLDVKTATGVLHWRPEQCLGQWRTEPSAVDLRLPDLDPEAAASRGASSLLLGVANEGGVLDASWIPFLIQALEAGLDLVSGLHQPLAGVPELLDTARARGRALIDVRRPAARIPIATGEPALVDFASRSPRMRRFLRLVNRVVDTDSSLLLTGETGVGKERLAQAIHNEGARASGPFVSVNCGAIPESLLESELFGHQPGAFTGAERLKRGRFELAERGTIFLDEIGEMPLHLQVNLLSVLQRRRVQRVGGEELIGIDVRVMAATNRDLEALVRKGRFREDLYYRLNVVTLEVPPLRERSEDIPDMVGMFIGHLRTSLGRQEVDGITPAALEALCA
ncbi:MAG: sigma 54-interacting transcriptional regulator [Planctomycetes bacterium]|nr:sigma 54-interacting transcriptional regulator [Planctomycetota bacterium]